MPMTLARPAAIAALALAAPFALAQNVAFDDGFEVGKNVTFNVGIGVDITQSAGETQLPRQVVAHSLDYAITRLESDGGAMYSLDITSGTLGYLNGETQTMLTIPAPPSEAEDDTTPARLLTDAIITFTIDADGQVVNIDGNEAFLESAAAAQLPPQLYGHFADDQLAQTLTNILRPADVVGKTREVGLSSPVASSSPVSNVAVFDFLSTWSLDSADPAMANLSANVNLTLRRPADEDPARPQVALNSHEEQRTLTWNREEGLMQQYRSTRLMTTTWTLGELTIEQTDESTTIITRNAD